IIQEDHAEVTYQCPMDCEEGKTYDEAGSCPVCKMDLKAMASDGAEPESHTADCACKKGGECQCEGGKCACKSAVSEKKECNKCAPGECGCKAETAAKKSACSAACKSGKAQKA
ncbi:MAG: heavy metal-binding domain-containing protein, partial [Lutibacter sp.]|nr:heavy metal-binding domain-containing protein [Lutibacter sp.]